MKKFIRDDTEHGQEYYLASDVNAFLERLANGSKAMQPEQEQWLQAVTTKIEAALLSHRLSLHNDVADDGVGFPLVDALCCGQTSLDIGKREVEDIAEAIYHVLDANTPPALAAQPEQEPLTDKQILANETLRYYFGQNGGAGPVSKQGRKVVDAIEAAHGIKGNT